MRRRLALFAAVAAGVMAAGGIAISQQLAVEFDTDRFGGDYREVPLRAGETYEACAKACVDDAPCQAWTWVPQGTQREEGPNCWLKDSTPEGGRVSGLVSGLRGAGLTPVPTMSAAADPAVGSVYTSDFNDLTIDRWDSDAFQARYEYAGGRLVGQADGSTVTGYWRQEMSPVTCPRERDGSRHYGRFEFRFSADRRSFTGRWSECDATPSRPWNGTFVRRTAGATGTSAQGAQNAQIVLFNGDDFGGRHVSLTAATPSLHTQQLDFGDATWSLAANGRWEVCEDVDFGGQCRIFEGDHASLRDFGGTISSARYVGPGAASAVLNQTDPRRGANTDPNRPRRQVPGVIERTGQAAADEAERRVQDRIREGIGRIF
ncbi:PAN domain-containing protein [Brevundimonas sp. VNH65]|uniref:PAN domain-containing protein n=1 Tax=Brevundimonas sp. VNH65 TaxID=3400917 RepID=UPI003C04E392